MQAPQVKLNSPVALWPEVGKWWSKLTWSGRSEHRGTLGRHSHEVAWLELAIDFEFTTRIKCMKDDPEILSWGQRAVLLNNMVKRCCKSEADQRSLRRITAGTNKSRHLHHLVANYWAGCLDDLSSLEGKPQCN